MDVTMIAVDVRTTDNPEKKGVDFFLEKALLIRPVQQESPPFFVNYFVPKLSHSQQVIQVACGRLDDVTTTDSPEKKCFTVEDALFIRPIQQELPSDFAYY